MSIAVRIDSPYQFADPIFDEIQEEYVWGIADPPDPIERGDDQFYEVRTGDRFDLIAHKMLGSARYMWIILHYNSLASALEIETLVGEKIRLPSRITLERVYLNVAERSDIS